MKEQISALVDDEMDDLERERALRALHADPALRGIWERYHLARIAVRRELDILVSPGLADRIHERLRHEFPEHAARHLPARGILKLTAGLAIAASVATIAILNLPPVLSPSAAPSVARSPAAPGKTAVADARQTPSEQQRALNPYLVHHGEFSPAAGLNGMITYVRVVGQDSANSAGPDNAGAE